MAPPVFSYLRGQHKRSGSSPSSPHAAHTAQWHPAPNPPPWTQSPRTASPVSPTPPVLPPIPRIASHRDGDRPELRPSSNNPSPSTSLRWTHHEKNSPSLPDLNLARYEQRLLPSEEVAITDESVPFMSEFKHHPSQSFDSPNPQFLGSASIASRTPSVTFKDFGNRPVTPGSSNYNSDNPPTMADSLRRSSSPSSSFSSFPKNSSSTHLAVESSPNSNVPVSSSSSNQHPRKPRMNLLNPVSLWMKRRTSQAENVDESALYGHRNLDVPAMNLPDDYDPRIKGKGVHDFSAPRPARPLIPTVEAVAVADSSPTHQSQSAIAEIEKTAPSSATPLIEPMREHKPAFVEDFEDDPESNAAVHRESLANSAFLARMSKQNMLDFAEPDVLAPMEDQRPKTPQHEQRRSDGTVSSSMRNSVGASTARSSVETQATSYSQAPPIERQPTISPGLEPPFEETSPNAKKLRSSASQASRFSFQLQGERSMAQEKALEEKGKAKQVEEAQKKRTSSSLDSRLDEVMDEEDYAFDDFEDGPYEEEIPGVNADDDDEEYMATAGLHNQRLSTDLRKLSLQMPEPQTLGEGPQLMTSAFASVQSNSYQGLLTQQQSQLTLIPQRQLTKQSQISDDMYFDDGLIEALENDADEGIDERFLDSPTEGRLDGDYGYRTSLGTIPVAHQQLIPGAVGGDDDDDYDSTYDNTNQRASLLNQQGLDAYHGALASAANRAAADGKFLRKASIDSSISPASAYLHDHELYQHDFDDLNPDSAIDLEDMDDYSADEDPMIAAANAEALAADDTGFYGREFGIGIDRSASARNVVKEPNLTPITERSEFSTRNSFISLGGPAIPPFHAGSLPRDATVSHPGLKDLMMADEDELSLSQLMKLRKETFGSSARSSWAGSPASNGGSPVNYTTNSPLAMKGQAAGLTSSFSEQEEDAYLSGSDPGVSRPRHQPAQSTSSGFGDAYTEGQQHSSMGPHSPHDSHGGIVNFATNSNDLEPSNLAYTISPRYTREVSSPVSPPPDPAAMQSTPRSSTNPHGDPSALPSPSEQLLQKFAARPQTDAYRRSYQRNDPVAPKNREIVTAYVQDIDPETGEKQWYQERRRRTSTGNTEVLGRQLVEGGRI